MLEWGVRAETRPQAQGATGQAAALSEARHGKTKSLQGESTRRRGAEVLLGGARHQAVEALEGAARRTGAQVLEGGARRGVQGKAGRVEELQGGSRAKQRLQVKA